MTRPRPVVIPITGDVSGLQRQLGVIDGRLERTGQVAHRMGLAIAGAFAGDALMRAVAAPIAVAGTYQQALTDVEAVTGANVRQMEKLDRVSRSAGLRWGTGATEFARAAGELARGNVAFEEIADRAGKATAVLSIAGNLEIPAAAEAMAKAGNVFKLSGQDFANLADYYANFANKTTGSVESLVQGMASFAGAGRGAFKALRDDALETVTALAIVEQNSGQTGSDAGTTARTALNRLPTEPGQKALKTYDLDFYNQKGQLLSLTGLAREARKELGSLTDQQRTRALIDLGGQDGYRFWKALLEETPEDVDRLRESLAKQGAAEQVAEKRNEGYARSLQRLRAAREDALITVGEGAAGQLREAADVLTESLADPAVQASLKRTGDLLGQGVAGGVEMLRDGFADGSIPRALEQIVDIGESAGKTLGDFAEIGGGVLDVVSQIPGPVMQAATAFALWRRASLALAGPLGMVGQRAAASTAAGAAAARGVPAAAAAPGSAILAAAGRAPAGDPSRRDLFGRWWEASRATSAIGRDTRTVTQQRAFAIVGNAPAAETRALGMQAQAMQRLQREAATMRDASRAAALRSIAPQVSAKGVGGVAAAGALGTAMGGSFLDSIAAGAAVGSMGGPWGAAGGAVAAAAGAGLKKIIKDELANAGEVVARGLNQATGGGGTQEQRRKLQAELERERRQGIGYEPGQNSRDRAKYLDNQRKIGTLTGQITGTRLDGFKQLDPKAVSKMFADATSGQTAFAKQAAAKWMADYVGAAREQGRIKQKDMQQILRDLGRSSSSELAGSISRQLDVIAQRGGANAQLKAQAGRQLQDVRQLMGRIGDEYQGLAPKAKVGFGNAKTEGERQLKKLQALAKQSSGETKRTIEADAAALETALKDLGKAAEPGITRAGRAAERTSQFLGQVSRDAQATALAIGSIGPAVTSIDDAIANSPAMSGATPTPKRPKANDRRGGGRADGFDIAVSPGEGLRMPDGSWWMVPGARVAADSVYLSGVDPETEVFTGHGLAMLAAGASREEALERQAPHFGPGSIPGFATGGKVAGKVSWFGGPNDKSTRGRKTALGLSPNTPGVAIRPGASFTSGRPYLGGYWDVHVGGKHSVLRQIDLGPHERTGKRIDITSAALGRFGFTEKTFPTGAAGWAAWLGKDRAAAYARAAKGAKDGSALSSPIVLGASKAGRGELVAGSFGAGFQLGMSGYGADDLRRFGRPVLGEIGSALGAGTYTRQVEQSSSKFKGGGAGGAGWVRPVSGPITSRYGARKAPTKGASTMHDGIDFGVPVGTPVHAAGSGTVTKAGRFGGYGNYVRLSHPGGYASFYGHLDSISTAVGRRVGKGATIARSGNTGTSTGPHLHFGMAKGGRSIDPASVIRMRAGGRVGGGVRDVGGVNVGAGLNSGGRDFYRRLGEAADDAVYRRVERVIGQLRAIADGPGDAKVIARARASISVLENSLGVRVGQMVGKSSAAIGARDQNLRATTAIQRIRGIDPNSADGIRGQSLIYQRFVDDAPKREAELKAAVARAERANARSKGGNKAELDAAHEALKNFSLEVLESKAQLADYAKATREEAMARREAATAAAASWAELTTTKLDDAEAKRQEAANARERAKTATDEGARQQLLADAARADREAARLTSQDRFATMDVRQARADATADPADNIALAEEIKRAAEEEAAKARASGDTEYEAEMLRLAKSQDDTLKGLRADAAASTEAQLAATKELLAQAERSNAVLTAQNASSLRGIARRETPAYPNRTPWGWG